MKNSLILAALLFSFVAIPIFSIENGFVEVYTKAEEAHLGRSLDRRFVTKVELNDFLGSESIDCGRFGINTAVIIDYRVKNAFEKLLENNDFYIFENALLTKERSLGDNVYGFNWSLYGFNIAFSFQPLSSEIETEISRVYNSNGYLLGEVKREYKDNFSIKIYRAENVLKKADKEISFLEAMISATVLGKTFQPLYGIHDGLGVLDNLGLLSVKEDVKNNNHLNNYRPFIGYSEEMFTFIHSVSEMNGDFIDNLYDSVKNITKKIPNDKDIQLPEEFFKNKKGDSLDYSLFFYDILKRKDYSVHLVLIDSKSENNELFSTVFFKEKDIDSWGKIDFNSLERNKTDQINRLPALIFSTSVAYFEPDALKIFETKELCFPLTSDWIKSLY